MKRTSILILIVLAAVSGCVSPPRELPRSRQDTIRRMKQLRLAAIDLRCSTVTPTLRDFEALARYAEKPFTLSAQPVRDQIAKSHEDWLATRRRLPEPRGHGKSWTEWDPPRPDYDDPLTTFNAVDISLHEALTYICGVSGFQWSIDQWNNVLITFKPKEGQHLGGR